MPINFIHFYFKRSDYKLCADALQEVDLDLVQEGLGVSESWTDFAEILFQLRTTYR